MIKIGLTGSIGMGKSTTAQMFADEGIPVWDADAAVARLYSKGGAGSAAIHPIAPNAVNENGVNRAELTALIKQDPTFLKKLEAIVHPLVSKDRKQFLEANSQASVVVLDIPLLFENGSERDMDLVVVVSVPPTIQRDRVMSRGTMDNDTFQLILSKQMPDNLKRQKADFVIETTTIEHARKQVQDILNKIRSR